MKKLKTRNEYVGCNGKVRYYADEIRATSYDWWVFVDVIDGKVVFNNYNYSNTTSRHQAEVHHLMNKLGIKIDLYVNMEQSLNESNFKEHVLHSLYVNAFELIVALNTKKVRKKTKKEAKEKLNKIKNKIKSLKKLGCRYTKNKFIFWAHIKNMERKNREKYIKETKGILGQTIKHKDSKKLYVVKRKDLKYMSVTLYDLQEKKKLIQNNWHLEHDKYIKLPLLDILNH
jgi:hypothetical protein